ncbi:hypothetical protein CPAR01_07157 [Colletotrichum paranaense]|uniref:Uncharacterized protein n=1 Tax=Colletotrichum paranaense TaxID=1914294 RepID=A0ABQ9SNT6_9PEZI|nr:uncharacterized protein CPAR01_07157 [Colletotrichum paranaense]KAK1541168.1 hypothetical protein CPAR01_07157 [Colletotrichum paranaense]
MKTSIAYIIAAALFGATQAAITPMNNIIRHEYNLNARAGVHGNIERDEPAIAPEGDVLQPIDESKTKGSEGLSVGKDIPRQSEERRLNGLKPR